MALTARARADLSRLAQELKDVVTQTLTGVPEEDQERLMAVLKVVVQNLSVEDIGEVSE